MYIYKTTNLINNKIYIGQSSYSVEESTNYKGSGTLLHLAFNKYHNENFTKVILERDIQSKEVLDTLEIYYIDKYNSTDRNIGYNITKGGRGSFGMKFSEEHKNKLSESLSGRRHTAATKKKMSEAKKGKTGPLLSEEHKNKLSESLKGRRHTAASKKKMKDAVRKPLTIAYEPCQYCGKKLTQGQMTRWHGDNCKNKSDK